MDHKNKISRTVPVRGSSTPLLAVTESGEVNALSLVVRKDIVRRGLSVASYMLACPFRNSEAAQEQTNNKNNRPIPKRA